MKVIKGILKACKYDVKYKKKGGRQAPQGFIQLRPTLILNAAPQ